jgi:SAM-dependent methyltransferase
VNGATLIFCRKTGFKRGDRVLDVGSMDVNGTVRSLFLGASEYVGIDMRAGKDVDRVMTAEDLPKHFEAGYFDVVVCSNALEHMERWQDAIRGMWFVLKEGGTLTLVTPTKEKGRHGYPDDYWRFTLDEYGQVFRDQAINETAEIDPRGVGVVVKKVSDSLHFDIEPYKVP